ncbi:tetratricopeptide repeat protein [Commensalibacter papalotli (ex Servin-Garciduenas et al. 2014)]|uniref:Uncharacterized protein n=1 Tax=Commensalibacter papalotli (ex Servin-Garciduenas et al. 2014) TaxID=1208583 RepID=W7DYQ0_9PROT|nr:tetratricopeptide repeat protein [Commensalibacter papalotli (ex Servin-Garciduenas et al. 2014)]EUK19133.1 hypothetical protein COMX_05265 [Commensalibacter papalotli (ex Servin-Garciduenas et al. 2014)]
MNGNDDPQQDASARFNLGNSYFKENNLSKARECWEVITREDDPKAYASARFNLGNSYFKENNLSKARECW